MLLVYIVLINNVTSNIIFSNRSPLSKLFALTQYLIVRLFQLVWWVLSFLFDVVRDLWDALSGNFSPAHDLRDHQKLHHMYKQVGQWSGLPWQVFWGIHAEETSLGKNLGSTLVMSVLPRNQHEYFFELCRELGWDPYQVHGSSKGAIGPFQFIPETWVRHAVDANGDGRRDPFDVEDAAYSAANYLIKRGGQTDIRKALWHYNQDPQYVKRVMRYLRNT